ncbi:MAG: plasmid mobilization relaxosome protein MobC [Sphingobacterium sp.]|jgi:hypothetical protein|uniref:plasmid mobilization protein n=1 Tax=Sphingobacterium sp. TaxID=341027 RepID=UPI00284D6119|nr:plasmid mobilization relaxosome protein MobC [Sphingobacterium sp.]MDR3008646.1 plasmid mobilization relaxosome protein MobC [Sphingobacterium sp.]
MEKKNKIRDKWLHLRLNEEEYAKLLKQFQQTGERKLSAYSRKILMGKPMIKEVRNASLQEVLAVLMKLQNDLNGIANNYNQMVKKLHTTSSDVGLRLWLRSCEKQWDQTVNQIKLVSEFVSKTGDKWLQ